ncbi:MAG TPA: hypothetical protein VHQ42_07330, partial [Candidatus Limnocylindria bacterium]|nr:hypothetical protein [Candidatus Limnocylindria bacterium]
PLASSGIGMLTWVTWLVLAPLSAIGTLMDTSVPFLFTTLGAVGTMLLLLPISLAVVNLSMSMSGRWSLLFGTGPIAFASVALAFLLAVGLLEAIGAIHSVRLFVGTEWHNGLFLWSAYGAFTMAALAFTEHALPRLLRREWGGGVLSAAQLWLIFGGATLAGFALMAGGLAEGSLLAQAAGEEGIDAGLLGYRVAALLGVGLLALGGLATVVNLFAAYTSAERADYAIPGQSATASAGH